jgi:hypothetical protein
MLMNPAKGIAFKVISAALFAVMQALIRYLGERYRSGTPVHGPNNVFPRLLAIGRQTGSNVYA